MYLVCRGGGGGGGDVDGEEDEGVGAGGAAPSSCPHSKSVSSKVAGTVFADFRRFNVVKPRARCCFPLKVNVRVATDCGVVDEVPVRVVDVVSDIMYLYCVHRWMRSGLRIGA